MKRQWRVTGDIRRLMDVRGVRSVVDLAGQTGIHTRTLYNRFQRPETFRLGEVDAILRTLRASDAERAGILFEPDAVARGLTIQ